MFSKGFLTVGRISGIPVRFHWSVVLGALIFSGFQFAPAFWAGFVALVLIHELGHAWVIRRLGHRALGVEVTGFGGLCHWDPRFASSLDHSLVAWGGVAAQFLLLVVALSFGWLRGGPTYVWEAQLLRVFTTTNLWLIVLNLLPFPPLDGARAWTLFRNLRVHRFPDALNPWRWVQSWVARRRDGRGPKPPPPPRRPNGPSTNAEASREDLARLLEEISKEARNARR